jgi:hypothetical protein
MADTLEQVLRLVAEGNLTAAQAAPILDALSEAESATRRAEDIAAGARAATTPNQPGQGTATALRIQVTENGRNTVDLRIPVGVGRFALDHVPGLTGDNADLIRRALAEGRVGQLVAIDDGEDIVRIALE